ELGYSGLAFEAPTQFPENLCEKYSVFQRLTLSLPNASRLKYHAKRNRNKTDLLVVQGRTKPISLAAAVATDVDMVMLSDINDFGGVDSLVARTLSNQEKPVEICLRELTRSFGPNRSRLMRTMATAVEHLVRAKCIIIITSGATTPLELRGPRDLIALAFLANIPEEVAKNSMYKNSGVLAEMLQQRITGHRKIKS
ncbi:MAG: RNase P subunit p30 family protein, partial [Promethearchaeota archaeon]